MSVFALLHFLDGVRSPKRTGIPPPLRRALIEAHSAGYVEIAVSREIARRSLLALCRRRIHEPVKSRMEPGSAEEQIIRRLAKRLPERVPVPWGKATLRAVGLSSREARTVLEGDEVLGRSLRQWIEYDRREAVLFVQLTEKGEKALAEVPSGEIVPADLLTLDEAHQRFKRGRKTLLRRIALWEAGNKVNGIQSYRVGTGTAPHKVSAAEVARALGLPIPK